MSSDDRTTMSMVLHGESGVGKSWLADTVPGPRLILDVEGRAKHTPSGPKIWWDPQSQNPPEADGTWDTCIVSVTDFRVLTTVYQWLRSGQHGFKSVAVDSLMEAQKRWMDTNKGLDPMRTQDWGAVLRELETFVRNMRDLVAIPAAHVDMVVIVTGSVPDDRGVQRPLLQGQLKSTLPYFCDVVGYLFVSPLEGGGGVQRVLQLGPTPYAVSKDGTGKLAGDTGAIVDPNLLTMYERLDAARKEEVNA